MSLFQYYPTVGNDTADLLFRNLLEARDQFKLMSPGVRPGYPLDVYFEGEGSESKLKFEFALPGVDPENINITRTKDGELRVKYDKPEDRSDCKYILRAISRKSFDLTWKISAKFDLTKLETVWDNGLLTISIPKSESGLPESVSVVKKLT